MSLKVEMPKHKEMTAKSVKVINNRYIDFVARYVKGLRLKVVCVLTVQCLRGMRTFLLSVHQSMRGFRGLS